MKNNEEMKTENLTFHNAPIADVMEDLDAQKTRHRSMVIIGSLFFIFGFVTWLSSVLIPYLQLACELNNFQSYLVAFSFYLSYVIMAIPSAWILKRTSYKKGMAIGLFLMAAGTLVFIPAALTRTYSVFLFGLFVQGSGLAILQTAANPYITILGPLESAAKRMSIMGICNGVAGVLAPLILGSIILNDTEGMKERILNLSSLERNALLDTLAHRVILPYFIMTVILMLLAIGVFLTKLPDVDVEKEEDVIDGNHFKTSILQFPHAMLGIFALFLYVGVEVIAGNTIFNYATSQNISVSAAKLLTSGTLFGMLAGYIIGIICIPKFFSQETALKICGISGLVFSLAAIFTSGYISVVFIMLLGLANSLIWPSIWPLVLTGLGRFTKIASSLLIMAIGGGAVLPLLYGYIADLSNEQWAYFVLIPCYAFIVYYAIHGYNIKTERVKIESSLNCS